MVDHQFNAQEIIEDIAILCSARKYQTFTQGSTNKCRQILDCGKSIVVHNKPLRGPTREMKPFCMEDDTDCWSQLFQSVRFLIDQKVEDRLINVKNLVIHIYDQCIHTLMYVQGTA